MKPDSKSAVDGRLEITSPSTLTFTPSVRFAPATRYVASLVALTVGSDVVTPSPEQKWMREFTTPKFAMVRMDLHDMNLLRKRVVTDIVFQMQWT